MRRQYRKAQSILEYTLLLGVVIAAIVLVLCGATGTDTGIKGKIRAVYNSFGNAISNTTSDLTGGVFGASGTPATSSNTTSDLTGGVSGASGTPATSTAGSSNQSGGTS